eukprot:COSAG03_NODE_1820_length_3469_cov_291.714497_5_plen_64_part_00
MATSVGAPYSLARRQGSVTTTITITVTITVTITTTHTQHCARSALRLPPRPLAQSILHAGGEV